MPKSKIIKAIVDDEVSLAQSLTRLQVIAHDLKNKELETWAESELVGYSSESDVPEYRHAKSINFTYSGINNMVHQVKNVPLDPGFLGMEVLEQIADVRFTQSITAFEALLDGADSSVHLDRSIFANEVDKNSNGGIQCFSLDRPYPSRSSRTLWLRLRIACLNHSSCLRKSSGALTDSVLM